MQELDDRVLTGPFYLPTSTISAARDLQGSVSALFEGHTNGRRGLAASPSSWAGRITMIDTRWTRNRPGLLKQERCVVRSVEIVDVQRSAQKCHDVVVPRGYDRKRKNGEPVGARDEPVPVATQG